jgi:hypothetical protein
MLYVKMELNKILNKLCLDGVTYVRFTFVHSSCVSADNGEHGQTTTEKTIGWYTDVQERERNCCTHKVQVDNSNIVGESRK